MASSSSGVDTTPASSTDPSRTATPTSAVAFEKAPDDSSKLKTFLGILKRCAFPPTPMVAAFAGDGTMRGRGGNTIRGAFCPSFRWDGRKKAHKVGRKDREG